MIDRTILEAHYAEYASKPDEWVANMEKTKDSIVKQVIKQTGYAPAQQPANVAVLGASDRRYLAIHERIFRHRLGDVQMVTYDIDAEHLGGSRPWVIQHDITTPFSMPGYDLIFSHELMKFLTPEEQAQTMRNAHAALRRDGLAMHVIHEPSIKGTPELRSWQYRVEPTQLEQRLREYGLQASLLEFEADSTVDWLRETTVVVTRTP